MLKAASLRRHPTATDTVLALAFAAVGFISVHAALELFGGQAHLAKASDPRVIAALLAMTLPLALRRRFPLSVAVVVVGAFIAARLALPFEYEEPYVGVWAIYLSLYGCVRYAARARASYAVVTVLSLAVVGEIAREVLFTHEPAMGPALTRWFLFFYNVIVFALPLVLAWAVRASRERERLLAAQTVELQRERQENARRAVLEERVRIARELHDVVAHHVSVMGIQAGAARAVLGTHPEKVEDVLGTIETSSREAVAELHRLLGFLRRVDQADGMAPQPDLSQLDELLATAARAGLTVDVAVAGERRPLAPTVELSAYRVIQEAVTNALKHSGAETATLHLEFGPTELAVELRDHPNARPPSPRPDAPGGHGLIGMRERVRLHGGHLRVGALEGGFAVHATFPLEGQAT